MHAVASDRKAGTRSAVALLLGLVLALRLVAAPIILQAPAPGLMAICSGGEIIYISMEDGQPVSEGEGPASASCPFFSVMSVLPGVETPVPVPVRLARPVEPLAVAAQLRAIEAFRDYRSRAPPLRA